MNEMVLTVRADELQKIIGIRPFLALPQEEIDRYYASVEVHPAEITETEKDPSGLPLVAIIAVHYNYSWLICTGKNDDTITTGAKNTLSLCLTGDLIFDGHNDIFLDESVKRAASLIVNDYIDTNAGYNLRLAGLLQDTPDSSGHSYLGTVFIVRLHQPGVSIKRKNMEIRFLGISELQQNRLLFDNWSRTLIDNISAL